MRLVDQALEGFGGVRMRAFGCEGLGLSGCVWGRHHALGLGEVHEGKKPEECEQDELINTMM
jgi:hypothetical protein